ncbi:hypothetical protein ACHAXT_006379 [Thalassiosira profunda]
MSGAPASDDGDGTPIPSGIPDWSPRPGQRSARRSSPDPSGYLGASIVQNNPRDAQVDEDILTRAVEDAGLSAFGAIFIEVWVLSTDGQHLTRPPGGHWMDPMFLLSAPDNAEELNRTAPDCAPGQSLAGHLFYECHSRLGMNRQVRWRQIAGMKDDPFIQTSQDERMEQLFDAGIGIVGAVSFTFQERKGMVLFMSRATADISKLRADENETYLLASADLIGAAFAIRIPRMVRSRIRRERFIAAVEKVRMGLKQSSVADAARAGLRVGLSSPEEEDDDIRESWERAGFSRGRYGCMRRTLFHLSQRVLGVFRRVENSVYKWKGAGLHAAPRQSFVEAVNVLIGTFFVMLTLGVLDDALKERSGTVWTFDPGWYASTLCIVFALTSAPVGQPLQIVTAHVWNALCGLAIKQIPSGASDLTTFFDLAESTSGERAGFVLPEAWKGALAVAFGISGQAFLGIVHPPASGLSYAFATRSWQASNILVVLLADAIVIAMGVVLLNLDLTKQYPMFWFGRSWDYSMGRSQKEGWFSKLRKKRERERANESIGWAPQDLDEP